MEGSTISGRYEVRARLANGGMGGAFRGCDRRLCRAVAVKAIPVHAMSRRAPTHARVPWWWEAWIMAQVRHPHVVTVYDALRDRDHGYVLMQLVEGHDLQSYLARSGPLPCAEVLRVGIQVCQALNALHTRGFIHCAVKPHNILRTCMGWVKLTDFGIAEEIGSRPQKQWSGGGLSSGVSGTSSAILVGTATYCSPEQTLCDQLTPATDIYSLGVVLNKLLAGIPPFSGETILAVITQHAGASVPALRRLCPDIPSAFREVILRALSKPPAQRYRSARAMCAALEDALADAVAAQPLPVPSPGTPRAANLTTEPLRALSPPLAASTAAKPPPCPAAPGAPADHCNDFRQPALMIGGRRQASFGHDQRAVAIREAAIVRPRRTRRAPRWGLSDEVHCRMGGKGETVGTILAGAMHARQAICRCVSDAHTLILCAADLGGLILLVVLLVWIH